MLFTELVSNHFISCRRYSTLSRPKGAAGVRNSGSPVVLAAQLASPSLLPTRRGVLGSATWPRVLRGHRCSQPCHPLETSSLRIPRRCSVGNTCGGSKISLSVKIKKLKLVAQSGSPLKSLRALPGPLSSRLTLGMLFSFLGC